MSKVLSYTPEWLSRPSPGFDFFTTFTAQPAKPTENGTTPTSKRLAHRGTEVFFVAGHELRWADLRMLQDAAKDDPKHDKAWRVLKVPVSQIITALSVSPDGSLIAIMTKHTCHVCVLPNSSHLRSEDRSVLRLRAFQVGPTAHVLEQAPLATALWHPLSPPGVQCLVTITKDACLRLWELDLANRYSFDQPTVAVDLKKLANATSAAADLSASKFGSNRAFSPDEVEMQVAAACFGGIGSADEHGWASMTLWFAMTEGDVYALCPFLPTKFVLPSTALPSLSTAVIAEEQIVNADKSANEAEKRKCAVQSAWLSDLDAQEPLAVSLGDEFDAVEVFSRPEKPGAIAKLQGPFLLSSEQIEGNVSDILVIAPKLDDELLIDEQDEIFEEANDSGVSVSIVCLATTTGRVNICLNLEDIAAEWLPTKRSRAITFDDVDEDKELLLYQTAALSTSTATYPTFTTLSTNRYEVLVTADSGLFALDFTPWIYDLEAELADEAVSGIDFRLKTLLESAPTEVQALSTPSGDAFTNSTTSIAILDPTLGHVILTATKSGPHAVSIDLPREVSNPYEPELLALPAPEARSSYQPPSTFFEQSELAKKLDQRRANPAARAELSQPIRSRPETLQLLTEAHRTLSKETHHLGLAAAELFRQCERMCAELHDQVQKVDELSQKVTSVTSVDAEDEDDVAQEDDENKVNAAIEARLLSIQSNNEHVNKRIDDIRKKMLKLGGQDLTAKERAYSEEVHNLELSIASSQQQALKPTSPGALLRLPDHEDSSIELDKSTPALTGILAQRLTDALNLKDQLLDTAENIAAQTDARKSNLRKDDEGNSDYKKQKLAKVMDLLERETALVEAVTARLARLGGMS